jgi:hypothetical protein
MTREEFDRMTDTEQAAALAKIEPEAPALPKLRLADERPNTGAFSEEWPAVPSVTLEASSEGGVWLECGMGSLGTCSRLVPTLADLAAWVREAQRALGQEEGKAPEQPHKSWLLEIDAALDLDSSHSYAQTRRLEAIRALQAERDELRAEVERLRQPVSPDATPDHPAPNGGHMCERCGICVAQHTQRGAGKWLCRGCWCEWAEAELSRLRARVAELGEGLRPFARYYGSLRGRDIEHWLVVASGLVLLDGTEPVEPTVAGLRRAAELLGKPELDAGEPPNVCQLCRKVWPVGTTMGEADSVPVCPSGACAEAANEEPDLGPAWEEALKDVIPSRAFVVSRDRSCTWVTWNPQTGEAALRKAPPMRSEGELIWTGQADSFRAALVAALAACPQAREANTDV